MSRFTIAAIAAAALSMSACGDNSPTTPTPTPPASVTDTFSGTLTRNGATTFPFNVSGVGTVYLTLTSVADSSSTVGMSLGTWNANASCSTILSNDAAVQGSLISAAVTGVGQLCARLYDVGKSVTPVDYQLTVVHP